MATDLSHGNPVVAPTVLLIIVWVVAFLRDRSVFLSGPEVAAPATPERTAETAMG